MKISRLCPGCKARQLEMSAAPCIICGRVSSIEMSRRNRKPHWLARILSWWLAPFGIWTYGFMAMATLPTLCIMRLEWIVDIFSFLLFLLSWLLLLGFWLAKLAVRVTVWLFHRTDERRRPGWKSFLVLPTVALTLWAFNAIHLPLRVSFWLSYPALENIRAKSQPNFAGVGKYRAGLFKVNRTDAVNGAIRLDVTNDIFISGGNIAGFAYCPSGCGKVAFPASFPIDNGKAAYLPLYKGWYWWRQNGSYMD